jgi:hypothetical protein
MEVLLDGGEVFRRKSPSVAVMEMTSGIFARFFFSLVLAFEFSRLSYNLNSLNDLLVEFKALQYDYYFFFPVVTKIIGE